MSTRNRGAVRHSALLPLLGLLLLCAMGASLCLGTVALGSGRLFDTLIGHGDPIARAILFDLRLPRTIIALLVGAMLGLGGAVLQGYLRNPLAEPSVLGASNAAALGAVGAMYFGVAQWHVAALPMMAIAGALIALALLFLLAGRSDGPLSIILAGVAVSTLAGAGITLALNLSPNPFAAMEIMSWLMGSIENRSMVHIWIALPCIITGGALMLWDRRALDALSLGEDGAQSLGFDLKATRLRLLLGVAIGIGGAVAVSGAVGFVGLIVPHILRPWTDRAPSSILIPSAIGGAILLLSADIAVRLMPTASELKLGVVTSFLGVPVFLFQLMKARRLW